MLLIYAVQEYQLKCFNTIFPIYRTILSVHILQPHCAHKKGSSFLFVEAQ